MENNNTGIIVASVLGGVAVLGLGGYLIYKSAKSSQTQTSSSDSAALQLLLAQQRAGAGYPTQGTGGYQQQPTIIQQAAKTPEQTYVEAGVKLIDIFFGGTKNSTTQDTTAADTSTSSYTDYSAYNDSLYGIDYTSDSGYEYV